MRSRRFPAQACQWIAIALMLAAGGLQTSAASEATPESDLPAISSQAQQTPAQPDAEPRLDQFLPLEGTIPAAQLYCPLTYTISCEQCEHNCGAYGCGTILDCFHAYSSRWDNWYYCSCTG